MANANRKSATVRTRNGYPLGEHMSDRSASVLTDILISAEIRAARNASAIRGMHK